MDENMLTRVLTTNDLHPYNISLVSSLWTNSTIDYLLQKKDEKDKKYVAFWMLRDYSTGRSMQDSYARSFWDMDFMPY